MSPARMDRCSSALSCRPETHRSALGAPPAPLFRSIERRAALLEGALLSLSFLRPLREQGMSVGEVGRHDPEVALTLWSLARRVRPGSQDWAKDKARWVRGALGRLEATM